MEFISFINCICVFPTVTCQNDVKRAFCIELAALEYKTVNEARESPHSPAVYTFRKQLHEIKLWEFPTSSPKVNRETTPALGMWLYLHVSCLAFGLILVVSQGGQRHILHQLLELLIAGNKVRLTVHLH